MNKLFVCSVCGYVYDSMVGDPDSGVPPDTEFDELGSDWVCPICGTNKDDFHLWSFKMEICDVCDIEGRGTVVTGVVETGILAVGDELKIVDIPGQGYSQDVVCVGIEKHGTLLDTAYSGESVGLLLREIIDGGTYPGISNAIALYHALLVKEETLRNSNNSTKSGLKNG